ncbi:MAG: hypothetical protein KCHDKBKB_01567 [Elusimicrobia bacterium]|nr:hypothetical protein [Elusimicrobiota bacterium]
MEESVVLRRITASFLICGSVFVLTGMARKVSINHTQEPKYAFVVGKKFETKMDLVLYQHSDSKEITVDEYGTSDVPKKEEMKDKFPHRFYGSKILGVLPAGSAFEVTRVMEEGTTSWSFITYFGKLISSENKDFVGKEIHVTSLANVLEKPPVFEDKYVTEIGVNSEK